MYTPAFDNGDNFSKRRTMSVDVNLLVVFAVLTVLLFVLILGAALKSIELSCKLKRNAISQTVRRTGLACGMCGCYGIAFLFLFLVGIRVTIRKIRGIVRTRT